MVFHGWSKSRVKIWKRQIIKRNEKNILALRMQQKECWDGSLHSGSIYYALQISVKKPDKALQEAIQKRLKR